MNEPDGIVHEAELVDAPAPHALKDSAGRFVGSTPGHGKPRGTKHKLTAELLQGFQAFLDSDRDGSNNPLVILGAIAADPAIPPAVRVSAAGRLCSVLLPKDMNLLMRGNTPLVDARTIAIGVELAKNPGSRGMLERAARAAALQQLENVGGTQRMIVGRDDTHGLPGSQNAQSQAVIEADGK